MLLPPPGNKLRVYSSERFEVVNSFVKVTIVKMTEENEQRKEGDNRNNGAANNALQNGPTVSNE